MNRWSKYVVSAAQHGYSRTVLDGILHGTRLSGFIPCNKMTVVDKDDYKIADTFEAFKQLDKDGDKWDSDITRQIELINTHYDITFAWIIATEDSLIGKEIKARPIEAHLIVEMPEVIMEWPHYRTSSAVDECFLGIYYVEISYSNYTGRGFPTIKFWQKVEWIDGSDYYVRAMHPHISNGDACWGDMKTNSYDPLKAGNVMASLTATKVYLNTYNKESPYAPLETWQNEVHTFRLMGVHMFQIGQADLEVDRVCIPRYKGMSSNSEAVRELELNNIRQNEGTDAKVFYAAGFSVAHVRSNYSMTYQEQQYIYSVSMFAQLMPLIVRLVLKHEISWTRALFIAIKAAYYEWKARMASAPKRWPQGVMKKSAFNELRIWAQRPDENKYYQLPGFYRWQYRGHPWTDDPVRRLERVSSEDMHLADIRNFISDIDTIRGRTSSFNLSTHRQSGLSDSTYRMISDPDYILGFKIYTEDEFALPNTQNKKLICRKLREDINALDGLYQNAKYKQNKRFIEIINQEKELIQNEANNYCPIATKDSIPFESL